MANLWQESGWVEQSGGGGGWTGNEWTGPGGTMRPTPPAPPDTHFLNEVFGKGYNKGWNEGHSAGFGNGYQSAANAMSGGKGKGSGGWQEEEAEAAEPGGKKPRKKKSGSSWKEFSEKYTAFDSDKEETARFYTRLGERKLSTYPQEIQEELLKAKEDSEADKASKDIVYDMTGGYFYNLRIFGGSEKEEWEEMLSEIRAGDGKPDGTLVGAQWKMKEAMAEPPKVFEKGVKFRPIFYSE